MKFGRHVWGATLSARLSRRWRVRARHRGSCGSDRLHSAFQHAKPARSLQGAQKNCAAEQRATVTRTTDSQPSGFACLSECTTYTGKPLRQRGSQENRRQDLHAGEDPTDALEAVCGNAEQVPPGEWCQRAKDRRSGPANGKACPQIRRKAANVVNGGNPTHLAGHAWSHLEDPHRSFTPSSSSLPSRSSPSCVPPVAVWQQPGPTASDKSDATPNNLELAQTGRSKPKPHHLGTHIARSGEVGQVVVPLPHETVPQCHCRVSGTGTS